MTPSLPLIAAIEAGGTKFNLALGTGPDDLRATVRIPTTTPRETMAAVLQWLGEAAREHGAFQAIGVGSFGPLELDPARPCYGYITSTPKPGWQQTDVAGPLSARFGVPVGFDTDVNAAALSESLWGAGQGIDPLVYLTIGTGVGGGAIIHGRPLHGLLHPEMGHLQVPMPAIPGVVDSRCQCPFHDSCLEGYVSGPAIAARWGARAETLPAGHPAWTDVAETLARGLVSIITTLAPRRIILGGGVMEGPGLLPAVRTAVLRQLNGYLQVPALLEEIDHHLVSPGLGDRAGVLGAIALGQQALALSHH
ncbi:MAG: ROK family protein [Verrucomicrobiota bacterium]